MMYQHASRDRDEAIAAAMRRALADARKKAAEPRSHAAGTQAPQSVVILVAGDAYMPLSWGFGLDRAKGIESS